MEPKTYDFMLFQFIHYCGVLYSGFFLFCQTGIRVILLSREESYLENRKTRLFRIDGVLYCLNKDGE